MVLFMESGRLGNQLFQYAVLRTLAGRDEALVLIGFDALRRVFTNPEAVFLVRSRSVAFRITRRLRPVVERLLSRHPAVTLIGEDFVGDRCEVRVVPGAIRALRYCRTAYFQAEALFDEAVVTRLRIREELVAGARAVLAESAPGDRMKVFVHVRRGDYLHWPSSDAPAAIPIDWYERCMNRLRERHPGAFFVMCSDDPAYLLEHFRRAGDVFVSTAGEDEDFVLMSQCDAGILSASAFSWWAAYFVRHRRGDASLLAPEYWIGHREKRWFPIGVQSRFLEYVPVPCAE
jgi:hypothetical protein